MKVSDTLFQVLYKFYQDFPEEDRPKKEAILKISKILVNVDKIEYYVNSYEKKKKKEEEKEKEKEKEEKKEITKEKENEENQKSLKGNSSLLPEKLLEKKIDNSEKNSKI